ncbi:MAG: cytochrome C oxidase subunit IV family protein [Bacteroidota bacterium]
MAAEGASQRKSIIRTALILSGLTAFEFLIAFTKAYYPSWFGITPETSQTIVVVTFIVLTIFKAFYIVAEFMHLGHEVKRLAWTILVPFLFIVWLIIGLISEGSYWGKQKDPGGVSMNETTSQVWLASNDWRDVPIYE